MRRCTRWTTVRRFTRGTTVKSRTRLTTVNTNINTQQTHQNTRKHFNSLFLFLKLVQLCFASWRSMFWISSGFHIAAQVLYRGGISFNTVTLWELSRRNFQFPLTWNNIKKVTFKNTFPKLGKNANLFYLNKNKY